MSAYVLAVLKGVSIFVQMDRFFCFYMICSHCRVFIRISSAINENILQLNSETAAYNDAVQNEKDKQKRLLRALNIKHGIRDIESGSTMTASVMIGEDKRSSEEIISTTIQSMELEIQNLETIRDNHVEELQNLNGLIRDQTFLAKTLCEQEDELLTEFYSLEIDAKDFQDVHRHLTFQCHSIEKEQHKLGLVQLHSVLFNILVDETDRRRYPLINNLRLTHTHRPNGVSLIEINAAWSQAAQLVILVGSTTNFKSRNLRVVPLSNCAKIIKLTQSEQKIVHDLGVEFANAREAHGAENIISSLRVFHELLNQLVLHILGSPNHTSFDKLPFQIKAESIGPFDLRKIDQTDYSAWSGIVHCMACIMKWMATNACKY